MVGQVRLIGLAEQRFDISAERENTG